MVPTEQIAQHTKENRVTYMINLFGSVIPIIMFMGYASTQIGDLATDSELESQIHQHLMTDAHPMTDDAIDKIQGQLNSILLYQIAERIESLLRIKCENPEAPVDDALRALIQQYDEVAGRNNRYIRLTCEELGVE